MEMKEKIEIYSRWFDQLSKYDSTRAKAEAHRLINDINSLNSNEKYVTDFVNYLENFKENTISVNYDMISRRKTAKKSKSKSKTRIRRR